MIFKDRNGIVINSFLAVVGVSGSEIGRRCGKHQSFVSRVIHGLSRSVAIERAIAEATNLSLHTLWPDWYDSENRQRCLGRTVTEKQAINARETLDKYGVAA